MMIDNIIYYILGVFLVSNIICVWKFTNLSVHFLQFWLLLKREKEIEIYTIEDFEKHMCIYWGWLGELLICPLCLSTHLSWIISLIFFNFSLVSVWFIPISAFSWPMFSYFFYCLFKKIST